MPSQPRSQHRNNPQAVAMQKAMPEAFEKVFSKARQDHMDKIAAQFNGQIPPDRIIAAQQSAAQYGQSQVQMRMRRFWGRIGKENR